MQVSVLKERFFELLTPPLPNDWEVEENLGLLSSLTDRQQELILEQVPAIWPVSNSLCYSYLSYAGSALSCLDNEQVGAWVAAVLDTYEGKGLKEAQSYMADVEGNYLCRLRNENGVDLAGVIPRLQPYAQGMATRPVTLLPGPETYTDTEKIFLPRKVTEFGSQEENFLFYKLTITTQLIIARQGTYDLEIGSDSALIGNLLEKYGGYIPTKVLFLENFLELFPDQRLAEDLYTLAEGARAAREIATKFTGLWRDTATLRQQLVAGRRVPAESTAKSAVVENLARLVINNDYEGMQSTGKFLRHLLSDQFNKPCLSAEESALKTAAIYLLLDSSPGKYQAIDTLPHLGRLRPSEADLVKLARRQESKEKFIESLAKLLPFIELQSPADERPAEEQTGSRPTISANDATALLIKAGKKDEDETFTEPVPPGPISFLTVEGLEVEMPAALQELAAEISSDYGQIPGEYIAAAQGLAGSAAPPANTGTTPRGERLTATVSYDEWDYRRKGFRKDWCALNEKTIAPVKGTFINNTLDKYRGLLIQLRKQFEMLRCRERFVKRQRDGDDIDLDALIESISDTAAGRSGSDKVFTRLQRDDRDIAVLFLIDMSSSTEGWVGEALKEALLLMGESLEQLGDRYAIAGFSGMRRSRSDFYHIKDFSEIYNEEIKGRIAAISPKEYTRMGPPLRHAVKTLQKVDARVRLLIVLSDGKPEDYDDYKGEYAIEDTRHALIEAKAAGIHPFCITIDQQAHDYMAHMYGEVNYIFMDKVSDLPLRMPAIYRHLTS